MLINVRMLYNVFRLCLLLLTLYAFRRSIARQLRSALGGFLPLVSLVCRLRALCNPVVMSSCIVLVCLLLVHGQMLMVGLYSASSLSRLNSFVLRAFMRQIAILLVTTFFLMLRCVFLSLSLMLLPLDLVFGS